MKTAVNISWHRICFIVGTNLIMEEILMKIAIYGCGAMGTVLGAFLNKNGIEVTLIDSYADHVKALNEKGAHIVGCADFTVPVSAITPEQMKEKYDIVFLFTKQTANSTVLPHLKQFLNDDSIVCTLQNGVPEYGIEEHHFAMYILYCHH